MANPWWISVVTRQIPLICVPIISEIIPEQSKELGAFMLADNMSMFSWHGILARVHSTAPVLPARFGLASEIAAS